MPCTSASSIRPPPGGPRSEAWLLQAVALLDAAGGATEAAALLVVLLAQSLRLCANACISAENAPQATPGMPNSLPLSLTYPETTSHRLLLHQALHTSLLPHSQRPVDAAPPPWHAQLILCVRFKVQCSCRAGNALLVSVDITVGHWGAESIEAAGQAATDAVWAACGVGRGGLLGILAARAPTLAALGSLPKALGMVTGWAFVARGRLAAGPARPVFRSAADLASALLCAYRRAPFTFSGL